MFAINRLPGTTLMCQRVKMPDLTLKAIHTPNPFNKLNYSASSADYGTLKITFKVDEDMANYLEIMNWMTGLGFPNDFKQYKDLKDNVTGNAGIRSDASLVIYDSSKNANMEAVFRDCFPEELSDFEMYSTSTEAPWIMATAAFSIRDFSVRKFNAPITAEDA